MTPNSTSSGSLPQLQQQQQLQNPPAREHHPQLGIRPGQTPFAPTPVIAPEIALQLQKMFSAVPSTITRTNSQPIFGPNIQQRLQAQSHPHLASHSPPPASASPSGYSQQGIQQPRPSPPNHIPQPTRSPIHINGYHQHNGPNHSNRTGQTFYSPTPTSTPHGEATLDSNGYIYPPSSNALLATLFPSQTSTRPSSQPTNTFQHDNMFQDVSSKHIHPSQQVQTLQNPSQAFRRSPSYHHDVRLSAPEVVARPSSALGFPTPSDVATSSQASSEVSTESYTSLMNSLRMHIEPMDKAYRNLWNSHVLEMKGLVTEVQRQGLERLKEEQVRTAEARKQVESIRNMGVAIVHEMNGRLARMGNELKATSEALDIARAECELRGKERDRMSEVAGMLRSSLDLAKSELDALLKERQKWEEERGKLRAEGNNMGHLRSVNGFLSKELEKLKGSEGSRDGVLSKMGETVQVLHKNLELEKAKRVEAERKAKELERVVEDMKSSQGMASTSQNQISYSSPSQFQPLTTIYLPEIITVNVPPVPEPEKKPIRTIIPQALPRRRVRLVIDEELEPHTGKTKVDHRACPTDINHRNCVAQDQVSLPPPQAPQVRSPPPTDSSAIDSAKRKRTNADNVGPPNKLQRTEQGAVEITDYNYERDVAELIGPDTSSVKEEEFLSHNDDELRKALLASSVEDGGHVPSVESGQESATVDAVVKLEHVEEGLRRNSEDVVNVRGGFNAEHMDLLYLEEKGGISCRVCYHIPGHPVTRLAPGVTWDQAVDHCVKEHLTYCRELQTMDRRQVAKMKIALGIAGDGDRGRRRVVDILQI